VHQITLNQRDLKCLEDNEWVTDNVVQYMLRKAHCEYTGTEDIYLFDVFFYSKLMEKNNFNYDMVTRWTKKIDIFRKDIVIIPLEYRNHWSLVCIVGLERTQSFNSANVPYILFFDSLDLHPYKSIVKNILK
jgi:sentrin-specific protease 1